MGGTNRSARRGGRAASGDVVARQRDAQKFIRTRTEKQVGEIAIYDALDFIGHLVPKGDGFLAFTAAGRFLGQRGSSRVAASLVYEAHRPGGAR